MGTWQQQFEAFMKVYAEDKKNQEARQEQQQAELKAHLEEMAREIAAVRLESRNGGEGTSAKRPASEPRAQEETPESTHQRADASSRGGYVPRYSKLDFPRYDGLTDPLGWLIRCEHFFRHQRTPEEEKVGLASFHLEGDGQLWFLKLERDRPTLRWEEFYSQCNMRFGPPIRSNKLGELSKLRQMGTVDEYQRRFEQLSARASTLTRQQEVEIFISGLKEYIAVEVEIQNPPDLTSAMSFARLYERRGMTSQQEHQPQQEQLSNNQGNFVGPPRSPFVKRLSREDIAERRAKNLCFNCDEAFTPGHRCKKLFWIEGIEAGDYLPEPPDDASQEAPGPEISLHAISLDADLLLLGYPTFADKCHVKGECIVANIDSGVNVDTGDNPQTDLEETNDVEYDPKEASTPIVSSSIAENDLGAREVGHTHKRRKMGP